MNNFANFTVHRMPTFTCQYGNMKIASYRLLIQPCKKYPQGNEITGLTYKEARAKWLEMDDQDTDCVIGFEYIKCPDCGYAMKYRFFPGVGTAHPDYEASLHCNNSECKSFVE